MLYEFIGDYWTWVVYSLAGGLFIDWLTAKSTHTQPLGKGARAWIIFFWFIVIPAAVFIYPFFRKKKSP